MSAPITSANSLAPQLAAAHTAGVVAVDTEFLRERTYYAQLCLIQLATPETALCVDVLAMGKLTDDLAPIRELMGDTNVCKVMHAARQDLEVLWPHAGPVRHVFDTQVAAGLCGLPAQIGYADLANELLQVHLAKSQTRTDWSRRPLSPEQIEYALDDVRYLLPLQAVLVEKLDQLGRRAWFDEEMRAIDEERDYAVDPEQTWRRVKGLAGLDPDRQRLAQALGAWREKRAMSADRPRGWLLPDAALRDIVLRVPRSAGELAAIAELPEGIRNNSGSQLLQIVSAAGVPHPPAPLPQRRRPEPSIVDAIARLADRTRASARELGLAPEILATRRDMERIVAGDQDVGPLQGWRRAVIGEHLLQAL